MAAPDLRRARRLLCVQPHYDDNDIGAGGTIAALADSGAVVVYVTVTDDLLGVLDPEMDDAAARAQLRDEQDRAGREIGVAHQVHLDYPDAGDWDESALRGRLVQEIRRWRPEALLTVDPWLPNEVHPDHLKTGRAAAQAVMLHSLPRVRTDPAVDEAWRRERGAELSLVAFYFTREADTVFDIDATRERKHRALDAYRAQFSDEGLAALHAGLLGMERHWARDESFDHGEALRVLRPGQLHVDLVG